MPEIDRHLVDLTGRRFGKLTVVTCCSVCNLAKSDTDYSSFVSWLSRAASNLASCNAPL